MHRRLAATPACGDRDDCASPRHLAEVEAYAERLREAISNAAIACDNIWAHVDGHSGDGHAVGIPGDRLVQFSMQQQHVLVRRPDPAMHWRKGLHTQLTHALGCTRCAGSTMTLAVISGWLFTMANCGDSNAILDTGGEVLEITNSHRIQVCQLPVGIPHTEQHGVRCVRACHCLPGCGREEVGCAALPMQANKEEQQRLKRAGAQLAPLGFHLQGPAKPQEMGVGPLRLW